MNAISKLRGLFLGDDPGVEGAGEAALPVPVVSGVGEVTAMSALGPGEAEALAEAAKAKAHVDDLEQRRESLTATVESLIVERAQLSRRLAAGEMVESDFAEAEVALSTSRARAAGLDELLVESKAACTEAYSRLAAAEAPRHAAERRQRVEAATAHAVATRDRFVELYAQAAAQLGALADELDSLAAIDGNAAFNVGYPLGVVAGDPLLRLTRNLWTLRPRTSLVPTEFKLIAVSPPAGR